MYGVVNTASEDDVPDKPKRNKRVRTGGEAGGSQAAAASNSASTPDAAGFTPDWREGMEERVVERSRQVSSAAAAAPPPSSRQPARNEELRIQEEMDDEEERNASFNYSD